MSEAKDNMIALPGPTILLLFTQLKGRGTIDSALTAVEKSKASLKGALGTSVGRSERASWQNSSKTALEGKS